MKNFEYIVKEEVGIHARPASQLVKAATAYKSEIIIQKDEKKADVKRLLALMALGVKCGEKVVFHIQGEDEEIAVKELEDFCANNL